MSDKRISVADAIDKMRGSSGKFMTVSFTKRGDNTLRVMNCRTGVSKGVKGVKGVRRARKNTGLMTVYDMVEHDFRNINVSGLRSLKIGGRNYKVV